MKNVVLNSGRAFAIFCAIMMVLGTFPILLSVPAVADPTDSDGDGLSDEDENLYGSNPDNPDSDGDGVLDGYLEFDTSKVMIADLDSGSIQRTLSMSRTDIEDTGEAKQYSVLGYRSDREAEILDYLYWLSPRSEEVELFERYPQLEDQFNKEFDVLNWNFIKVEQSFIPNHDLLSSVDVYLDLDGDDYLYFSICDFNKVPLYSIGVGPTGPWSGWLNFEIEPDLVVVPGYEYWIVVELGAASSAVGFHYSTDPRSYEWGKLIVYTDEGSFDFGWDLAFVTHYQHLPELIDQEQVLGTEAVGSYFEIAQSFIPTHHHLTSARVNLFANTQAWYVLEIHGQTDEYPPGQVLTSMVLFPEFEANPAWFSFDFPDIEVVPGNTYWLILRSLPPLPIVTPVVNSDGESYPFGELWVVIDSGSGYVPTTWDLNFIINYHHVIQIGDQEQTSGGASAAGCPRVGQSFIPEVNTLSSVYLHIANIVDVEVSVEIHDDRDGKPSGVARSTAILNLGSDPIFRWVLFDFQDISVSPGTKYWIVFDPDCDANYIVNMDPDSYPDGEMLWDVDDWAVAPGYDLDFRTNHPKDFQRSVIPVPFSHKLEKERQVEVSYRPVQNYSIEYWTKNILGPMKIVVSNEDNFVPYASAFAHRNYGAFVETAEEAEALLRGSQPECLYYLGTDVILDDLLTHIIPPTVDYLVVGSVDSSENLLTRTFPPDVLDTQELQTSNTLSVIHSRDDSSLEEERQLWKVAAIYVSMRQTMLVSIDCPLPGEAGAEYAMEDADDSITDKIENKIVPLNDGELPEYLIIIGHWKTIPYQKVYGWVVQHADLAFETYYSPGNPDQYQHTYDSSFIAWDDRPLAQSFVPDQSTLTSVRIRGVSWYPASDVTVRIVEDDHWEPTGSELGSSGGTIPYVTSGTCSDDSLWVEFPFPSLTLEPGNVYWILVEVVSVRSVFLCGSDFDDAYPKGLLKEYTDPGSPANQAAADHVYADLHFAHGAMDPDMAVGRLMAYDHTTVTLLMNRGPFFDRGGMIKAWRASSVGNFAYTNLEPELSALYGGSNVYDWFSTHDGIRGEYMHFHKELLNELQRSEFVEINAHSTYDVQWITVPGLWGYRVLGHKTKPPSLYVLNGCWTGDYKGEESLIDAFTRVGAANLLVGADSSSLSIEKPIADHLYQGKDIGKAYEAALLESPIYELHPSLRFYLIGDPMVNYGRFMDFGWGVVNLYPDTDNDGLADKDEIALGTGMWEPDSDGDDLPDGLEVVFHFTNPLLVDTDGDGTWDGDEFDSDDDNLADGKEYGVEGTDIFNWDTDGDLLSDGEEVYWRDLGYLVDPLVWDTDGDTYPDYVEVYSDVALFQESSGNPNPYGRPFVRTVDRHGNTYWDSRSDPLFFTYSVTLEYNLLVDKVHLISSLDGQPNDVLQVWIGGNKVAEVQPAGPDETLTFSPVVTNLVELHIYRDWNFFLFISTLEIYGQLP